MRAACGSAPLSRKDRCVFKRRRGVTAGSSRPAAKAWLRGALRRPGRAVVVIATLALMTVGVVGALVAADSLDALFVADAMAEWGDTDVVVTSDDNAVLDESLGRAVGVEAGDTSPRWAPRLILPAVAEVGDAREPDTNVFGVGAEEQAFAALEAVAGAGDPLTLPPDGALLNQRLAERLDAAVGDELTLLLAVPEVYIDVPASETDLRREPASIPATFEIAGIVADRGLADLRRTPNVIVRRDALQRITDLEGLVTEVHLGATAPTEDAADEVVRAIQPLLRQAGMTSATVKADALTIADDEGGQFRSILLTLALLVIAAAVVAAIQMLTALAQDRSREIAVLRALGVGGRAISRLVAGESLLYGVIGGVAGTLLALPAASVIARLLADHFAALSAGRGREQVALEPLVDPATLVTGAIIVLVSAALAGRAAGRRLAETPLDTLLRGPVLTLPQRPLSERRVVVVALLGSLILGTGLTGGEASDALRYLGLTMLGAAAWMRLRRVREDRERVDTIAAVLALAWATLGAGALADFSQGYETGFGTLVIAGVVSIVGTTVLIAGRFRGVMRLLRSYAPRGRWQTALRTAGAYAEAAPGRTGRLLATFGIVLFMAAALQVLGTATQIDVARQSGGFAVLAEGVGDLDRPDIATAPGVGAAVALQSTVVPEDRYGVERGDDDDADVLRVRYPVRLVGATGQLPETQSFGLADALPGYETAAEALEAVIRDGDKAVVDRYARPPGAELGDDVVLDLGGGLRRYELIGVLDTFLLGSVFIGEPEFLDLVSSPGATQLLAMADGATSPAQLAANLETAGRDLGLVARTMEEVAEDTVAVNRTFTDTFALMLLLGLAVALVAVAALLARSTLQRRPQLAVLRALGLRRSTVAVTVAAEPIAVAAVGGIAGLVVGLIVLRVLFAAGFSDLAFVVDVGRSLAVLGIVFVLLAVISLATAWPAVPRDPSAALRDIG